MAFIVMKTLPTAYTSEQLPQLELSHRTLHKTSRVGWGVEAGPPNLVTGNVFVSHIMCLTIYVGKRSYPEYIGALWH